MFERQRRAAVKLSSLDWAVQGKYFLDISFQVIQLHVIKMCINLLTNSSLEGSTLFYTASKIIYGNWQWNKRAFHFCFLAIVTYFILKLNFSHLDGNRVCSSNPGKENMQDGFRLEDRRQFSESQASFHEGALCSPAPIWKHENRPSTRFLPQALTATEQG